MSLAHDLRLPNTYFFGESSFIWPLLMAPTIPFESPPRFKVLAEVYGCRLLCCKRCLHLLKLSGHHTDSADICMPPLSLQLAYKVDPWMLLQSEIIVSSWSCVSLQVNRCLSGRVPSRTRILLWMLSTVSHISTSNVIFLPVNDFTNIVNVNPCSATMVVESVHNV